MYTNGHAADLARRVDRDRILEVLHSLVAIPSQNPLGAEAGAGHGEADVATWLASRWQQLGATCHIDTYAHRRCNLSARLGSGLGERPKLGMGGHLDTVAVYDHPEGFGAVVRDGQVFGRGTCDMKAALACVTEVAHILVEAGCDPGVDLVLVGVADEEYEMTGARRWRDHGPRLDALVIGEPTSMRLCTAAKGRVSARYKVRGRSAHSSSPEAGVNAITAMAQLVTAFDEYARSVSTRRSHPLLGGPRANAGVIAGGTQVNIVPDQCTLEVDRRTLPSETAEDVLAEFRGVLENIDLRTVVTGDLGPPTWLVPPLDTPTDQPVARAVAHALAKSECDSAPTGFVGGSDADYFGVPAVLCGPGDIAVAHSTVESVAVEQLATATEVYLRTVLNFGTFYSRRPTVGNVTAARRIDGTARDDR